MSAALLVDYSHLPWPWIVLITAMIVLFAALVVGMTALYLERSSRHPRARR